MTPGRREQTVVHPASWFERRWSFNLPVGAFPAVLERLAGTPPRAAALVAGMSEARLAQRPMGKWSAKEHLGHLSDLHTLDVRRVEEFLGGAAILTAADTSNRRTEDARHGDTPIARLLDTLALQRRHLLLMLENLTEKEVTASAVHPRLQVRLRLIDWAQFVAEHDDHHLASARIALRSVDRLHTP